MDRGAWWATVHRVAKGLTKLSMLATLLRCKVEINELKKTTHQNPCEEGADS